jgi:hypothetical protein
MDKGGKMKIPIKHKTNKEKRNGGGGGGFFSLFVRCYISKRKKA